jgi:gamma-glutamyltranspeptidase / glutathione hydrolase
MTTAQVRCPWAVQRLARPNAVSMVAPMFVLARLRLLAPFAAALICACQAGSQAQAPAAPVAAATSPVMVAGANPLAVEAALKVLRAGGGAVDAAIAIQSTLGLVEPQSSGLGGGAYMTYYEARTRKVTAYDGREFAPASAGPDWFLRPDGTPLSQPEAVRGGRSTGVPGVVAMLAQAHADHGLRPWNSLFAEAERLAAEGFVISPRLAGFIGRGNLAPDMAAYFTKPDGGRMAAGDTLKNPAYAATLRRLAAEGPKAFYEGEIPRAIVARVAQAPVPSTLSLADFAAYRPKVTDALCRPYRVYVICAPPAPSGGPGLLQAFGILETTDIAKGGPADPRSWFIFAEASRLMYADRDRYVADPDFVRVPVEGLLDPAYTASRARLIGERAGPPPTAGTPPGASARAPDATLELAGTSHFVIIDARGDVLSMTTTVESPFGSGRMAGGFVLNNQLTDFSLAPTDRTGAPVANAVGPRKRPRSSMAPAIVLDREGRFVAAVGSPGGNAILAYNLKALVGFLDWNLSLQEAVELPNLIARGPTVSAEVSKFPAAVVEGLAARGFMLRAGAGEDSGLHGVAVRGGRLQGAADPRREGVARGP